MPPAWEATLGHSLISMGTRGEVLAPLRRTPGATKHVVMFPFASGGPSAFFPWLRDIPRNFDVSVIHLPGRGARVLEPPYTRMQELVEGVGPALQRVLAEGPPALFFAYSFGCPVAFEVTQYLLATNGILPLHLLICGMRAPHCFTAEQLAFDMLQSSPIANIVDYDLPDQELMEIFQIDTLANLANMATPEERAQLLLPLRADLRVLRGYFYEKKPTLPIPITAIGGRIDHIVNAQQLAAWEQHTSATFTIKFVPGDHAFIHPNRQFLIQTIRAALGEDERPS